MKPTRLPIKDRLTDPRRRPRIIIWTGVVLLFFAVVMIGALSVTSSYWFCANACHKVMDDPVVAFDKSNHNRISCYACHMPVGANVVTFMLHKMEALGELYMYITGDYSVPLNANDQIAMEMPTVQCMQCHTTNRAITPTTGIKISHSAHAKKDIACTICHNRVAHPDEAPHVNKDPKTGVVGKAHPNWMSMTACFRCHSQKVGGLAPGRCSACHTPDFPLKPATHYVPGFYPAGHGKLALAEMNRTRVVRVKLGLQPILQMESTPTAGGNAAEAESGATKGQKTPAIVEQMPPVEAINVCYTCHDPVAFCVGCHGVAMPHPKNWQQVHGAIAAVKPASCARCHGAGQQGCNSCHHGTEIGYTYNPAVPWRLQHPTAVNAVGATRCFRCHDPSYCATCHVTGSPPATP